MDPLRCIVLHDRLILLLPDGADSDLDELGRRLYQSPEENETESADYEEGDTKVDEDVDDVEDWNDSDGDFYSAHRDKSMKLFPFRAVEAVVSAVVNDLENDLANAAKDVKRVLRSLHSRHSATAIQTLDSLRVLKNQLATQEARAHMTKVALDDVLNDDQDMALMCFIQPSDDDGATEEILESDDKGGLKAESPPDSAGNGVFRSIRTRSSFQREQIQERQRRGPVPLMLKGKATDPVPAFPGFPCPGPKQVIRVEDHEVFELLFEAYSQSVSTVETSLELLRTEIVNGEQFHDLCLTTARNRLLAATLGFTIISMCTGMGSFVGSIFGMNVLNGYEEDEGVFNAIAISTSAFVLVASLGLYFSFVWSGMLGGVSE